MHSPQNNASNNVTIRGINQITGTCWINAVINSIIFGKNGKNILGHFLQKNKETNNNPKFYAMIQYIYNYAYNHQNDSFTFLRPNGTTTLNGAKELMHSMGKNPKPLFFCDGGSPNQAFRSLLENFLNYTCHILNHKDINSIITTKTTTKTTSKPPNFLIFQTDSVGLLSSAFPSFSTFSLGRKDIPDTIMYQSVEYVLEHAVESINTSGRHAIACGFIGDMECRYDSDKKIYEIKEMQPSDIIISQWSKLPKSGERISAYTFGNTGSVYFCYICYSHKNFFASSRKQKSIE